MPLNLGILEDMYVDIYNYFDKSTERKSLLVEFADFLEVEYRQVIKLVNTRCRVKHGNRCEAEESNMSPVLNSYFLSNTRHGQCNDFVLRLLGKFVRIDKNGAAKTVDKDNFKGESQQLKDSEPFIGFAIKKSTCQTFQ